MTPASGEAPDPASIDSALDALFARLRRDPDFDAEELLPFDATDHLLLRTVAADRAVSATPHHLGAGELAVIGDRHGALTLGAATALGATAIRTHQDPLLGELALQQNAEREGLTGSFTSHALGPELLDGARTVLLQLPRGLDALTEIAEAIARWARPEVRVYAGGRVKHMTRGMNDVLGRSFADVSAGLGWRKSRLLFASGPRREAGAHQSFPRWGSDPAIDFDLAAFGATFGGPVLDRGSRLLLGTLASAPSTAERVVDLGCGNGVLAVSAARALPRARVIATDQSTAAVEATRLTSEAAGVADRVEVHREDATDAVSDEWADLILLNPPFHTGATVHAGVAHRLIRACARALAPGGELRLVFNSHLRYRSLVEQEIGPTRQLARDATFTVLSARRRGA